jgi:hypothetical protein
VQPPISCARQIGSGKTAGWTFLSLSELLARRDRLESLRPRWG